MVNKIISNKRKARVRKKLKKSSSDKMRLSVFRSAKHIYAQIIDDSSGITVVSASTLEKSSSGLGSNISSASKVGSEIAKKLLMLVLRKFFSIEVVINIMAVLRLWQKMPERLG